MKTEIDPMTEAALQVVAYQQLRGHAHVICDRVLPPIVYRRYNAVMEALGGHWSKKDKAHVFPDRTVADVHAAITAALAAGFATNEVKAEKKANAFFATPPDIADFMAEASGCAGKFVLEPSAGEGALVKAALDHGAALIVAVDINEERLSKIRRDVPDPKDVIQLVPGDFLRVNLTIQAYDVVLMNPPFTRGADVRHVLYARRFLKPGGVLVALMADRGEGSVPGGMEVLRKLPAGTFPDTKIATIIVRGRL